MKDKSIYYILYNVKHVCTSKYAKSNYICLMIKYFTFGHVSYALFVFWVNVIKIGKAILHCWENILTALFSLIQ